MENFEQIKIDLTNELQSVSSKDKLAEIYSIYLGKTGKISSLMSQMRTIPNEQKKEFGMKVNSLKTFIENLFLTKQDELVALELNRELSNIKKVDLTVPSNEKVGSLHPITVTQQKLIKIFLSMGFYVEDGGEIETDYNNFEAVNIPKNHPARDMQDTFYLENGQVLKTHTSASQNRILKKYGAPLKVIFPGRCYRNEQIDASHDNTFFQLEGMVVDENVNISNLIYFMKKMLSEVFETEIDVRLRPGFFPFVEPGFELDIKCPYCGGTGCKVCKGGGWIELCPCGMIHPEVLRMGGIDVNKYQGFAFGLGLSRLTMMSYKITEIRLLNGGNVKALKQTKIN